ncbi:MAG TPA: D-glycerate dehydrogenase [Actinomycetota bacterium]|nr:D-glycerate dehydrogenase [Actinomycetota bacterium]
MTEPHLRPNVLVTRRLPPGPMERVLERCEADVWEGEAAMPRDDLMARIKGKAGAITLLTERIDGELLDAAGPDLLVVANYAVGFDNIDVEECTRRGVLVSNTPDVLTETTADLAWTLLMTAARRVAEGDRFLRSRRAWIWAPEMMLGQDVNGKVLGVVGFGRIGQSMARRASGFGMRVIYYDVIRPPNDVARELRAEYREFDDLLAEADLISIHVALTPETRHLFGAEQFRRMKHTAVLVNTSRGPVIDEAALVDALRRGEIFGAGLDVFENEPQVHPGLLELDNVVVIPHLGSATVETRDAMGFLAVENLHAALQGRRPPTLVNPQAWEARSRT